MLNRQEKNTDVLPHTSIQKGKFREAGARPRVNMLRQRRATNERKAYKGCWWIRQDQRSVQAKGLKSRQTHESVKAMRSLC